MYVVTGDFPITEWQTFLNYPPAEIFTCAPLPKGFQEATCLSGASSLSNAFN